MCLGIQHAPHVKGVDQSRLRDPVRIAAMDALRGHRCVLSAKVQDSHGRYMTNRTMLIVFTCISICRRRVSTAKLKTERR